MKKHFIIGLLTTLLALTACLPQDVANKDENGYNEESNEETAETETPEVVEEEVLGEETETETETDETTEESETEEETEEMAEEDTEEETESPELPIEEEIPYQERQPQYVAYDTITYEENLGTAPMVLFFHADWCPTCLWIEDNVTAEIESFPKGTLILEVNFDKERALKEKYNIILQSTLVVLDKTGAVSSILAVPSNEELLEEINKTL